MRRYLYYVIISSPSNVRDEKYSLNLLKSPSPLLSRSSNFWRVRATHRTRFHFLSFPTAGCPKVSPRRDLDKRLLRLVRQTASGVGLSSGERRRESLPTSFALGLLFSFSLSRSFRPLPYSFLTLLYQISPGVASHWVLQRKICRNKKKVY